MYQSTRSTRWKLFYKMSNMFNIFNATLPKITISAPFGDPIEPKKIEFFQKPMVVPPIPFWGL